MWLSPVAAEGGIRLAQSIEVGQSKGMSSGATRWAAAPLPSLVRVPVEPESAAELPTACDLEPANGADRMRRWQHLAAAAAPTAVRRGGTLEVRYRDEPGVLGELQDLAAAESTCCGHLSWQVVDDGGEPLLRVDAAPDTPDAILEVATLFGA